MRIIQSNSTDPCFNIASEEYIFNTCIDNVFYIYRDDPSVIIGKHQNALKEMNYRFVRDNNIKLVRRISGGGTVYHDLGNINFTFLMHTKESVQVDFKKYTFPVLNVLKKLGLKALFTGKSNLTIEGKKFSGNAAHVYKNKVLHHGTILFSSHLDVLHNALTADQSRFSDKAVNSKRSEVINISDLLDSPLTISEFMEMLITQVTIDFGSDYEQNFSKDERDKIEKLVTNKYATWDWNYGYSPRYQLKGSINYIPYILEVEKGIIRKCHFKEVYDYNKELSHISEQLQNLPHCEELLINKLGGNGKESKIAGISIKEFVAHLF